MYIQNYNIESESLPMMTVDQVRDDVREGSPRTIAWHLETSANTKRENFLATLREFTQREFLILDENETPIARLKEPSPPPFPDVMTKVHQECAKHMTDIRNRSNALLHRTQPHGPDFNLFMSGCLVDIERVLQRTRNQLEVTFYQCYINDTEIEIDPEALSNDIANMFITPTYTIEVLEQSMKFVEQSKRTTPQN